MTLTFEKDGKIILPDEIKNRFGFKSETTVKIAKIVEKLNELTGQK